ncbi:heavy-metal-associated domain-containing protein [Tenacibaculum agarivorans]|uniref:heavy-metal-associated domain-containing protein n=1 Tax=Tenacibaculum agarivorans TaxID=1908389 RepID=UPI00094BB922|nr:cation transporter [Tenacibaculum agarivorans]
MKKILTIICLVAIALTSQAQKKKKNAKLTLEVDGVCMMCKKRIEKAALHTKGVKFANWDVKSHQLMVIIDERKTDKKTICESVAGVGHDTKELKATEAAYNKLDPCCKYRDEEVVKNHH